MFPGILSPAPLCSIYWKRDVVVKILFSDSTILCSMAFRWCKTEVASINGYKIYDSIIPLQNGNVLLTDEDSRQNSSVCAAMK